MIAHEDHNQPREQPFPLSSKSMRQNFLSPG